MIEYLEADLTVKTIDALNPEDLAVAEYAKADEPINSVAKPSNEMEIGLEEEKKDRRI